MNEYKYNEHLSSPRVLLAHKLRPTGVQYNEYTSSNYGSANHQYETKDGQLWGNRIIGFAETNSNAVIRTKSTLQEFIQQIQEKATVVFWKHRIIAWHLLEDEAIMWYKSKGEMPDAEQLINQLIESEEHSNFSRKVTDGMAESVIANLYPENQHGYENQVKNFLVNDHE